MANTPRFGRESNRTRYVLGFAFNGAGSRVALIRKLHEPSPSSNMVGSLNGLGGRVDAGENYLAAMRREFKQEAGALVAAWRVFAIIEGRDYRVYCHVSRLDIRTWHSIRTGANSCTIERVDRFSTARVRELAVYPDLRWLIPLALDVERVNAVARIDRRAI